MTTTRVSDFDQMVHRDRQTQEKIERETAKTEQQKDLFAQQVYDIIRSRTDEQLALGALVSVERIFPPQIINRYCRPFPKFGQSVRDLLDKQVIKFAALRIKEAQPLYPPLSVAETLLPIYGCCAIHAMLCDDAENTDSTLPLF